MERRRDGGPSTQAKPLIPLSAKEASQSAATQETLQEQKNILHDSIASPVHSFPYNVHQPDQTLTVRLKGNQLKPFG